MDLSFNSLARERIFSLKSNPYIIDVTDAVKSMHTLHNYLLLPCLFLEYLSFAVLGVCNGTNTTCAGCDGIPHSGKEFDACRVCDGDGSTCTDIMKTEPKTISSCHPNVLVFGAGLNTGNHTLCVLYNDTSGEMVVNTTGNTNP